MTSRCDAADLQMLQIELIGYPRAFYCHHWNWQTQRQHCNISVTVEPFAYCSLSPSKSNPHDQRRFWRPPAGSIGIARIFSEDAFFLQRVDDLLVVILKTQARTAELTTPILHISPPIKNILKNFSCSAGGPLTAFPCKLRPRFFSPP